MRYKNITTLFSIAGIVIGIILCYYNFGLSDFSFSDVIAIVPIVIILSFVYLFLDNIKQREKDREDNEINVYLQRLNNSSADKIKINEHSKTKKPFFAHGNSSQDDNKNNNTTKNTKTQDEPIMDPLVLMQVNLANIREYYIWSQKQAKHAFSLAVGMCICGFLLLAFSILVPILWNVNIELSIITATGGAVVELIAGTALIVYRGSVKQLNYYHKSLHEDERFLSSVNLIDKFKNEEKYDKILEDIIRSELQMNLVGVGCDITMLEEDGEKHKIGD